MKPSPSESQITDLELVTRCKRELPYGHRSFELLIDRYKNMVFTLCYRLVGVQSDAEDLMQEIFTKVFLNLAGFEERSAFSSWLYRIAHNHCLNHLAKRKREMRGMLGLAEQEKIHSKISAARDLADPVQAVLNDLNEDQKSLLILKYVMELELAEISEILGTSVGAVKMRLLRARQEFQRSYRQLGESKP